MQLFHPSTIPPKQGYFLVVSFSYREKSQTSHAYDDAAVIRWLSPENHLSWSSEHFQ